MSSIIFDTEQDTSSFAHFKPNLISQFLEKMTPQLSQTLQAGRSLGASDAKNTRDHSQIKPRAIFLPQAKIWILCQMSAYQNDN